MKTSKATWEERARERVRAKPSLQQYADLLLGYERAEEEEHYRWVAKAPLANLIGWAEDVRAAKVHEELARKRAQWRSDVRSALYGDTLYTSAYNTLKLAEELGLAHADSALEELREAQLYDNLLAALYLLHDAVQYILERTGGPA